MSFHVTTKDIKQNLEPLGFEVEIVGQCNDDNLLCITRAGHKEIAILATVLNGQGRLDELIRKSVRGSEKKSKFTVTPAEFEAIPENQRNRRYKIDFGEDLDADSVTSMDEFVKLVQDRIVPNTTKDS